MRDLLIEIGTEELPSSVIEPALNYIKEKLSQILGRNDLETYSTPRRLAIYVKDFEDSKEVKEEVVFGPPWKVAFDEKGKPTKALAGFLERHNATPEKVFKASKGKGEYVALKITHQEKSSLEKLKEEFENILLSVPLPKRMRWSSSKRITFSRPIRWIVALHGSELIDLSFGEVVSGKKTKGHRLLSDKELELNSAKEYLDILRKANVEPSPSKRKEILMEALGGLSQKLEARLTYPEGLVEEVVNIVEYPFVVEGSFEEKFLELPDMVIVVVAAHHQRFFCFSKEGKLINKFAGVSNNKPKTDLIRRGYEKVLKARLEDALFFYREDLKKSLEELIPSLSEVLVHPKIGSMLDKVNRLKKLSAKLSELTNCDETTRKMVSRAVELSKADLLTEMVKELDELQGYMGYVYALQQGEEEEVAVALNEQYKPKSLEDSLPKTTTGAILSLSDKIDDLISFFNAGEIPKGSSDPYGLRRSAFGIFRILEDRGWDIDIESLSELYGGLRGEELKSFLSQRLESYLEEEGYDLVRAVLSVESALRPLSVIRKVRELSAIRNSKELLDIYEGYRRVVKILPKEWEISEVSEELLKEAPEKELWREVRELEKKGQPTLRELANLRRYIDDFFDNVLVMDKEESIKRNRLSMLKRIKSLFNKCADFSEVVIQEVK